MASTKATELAQLSRKLTYNEGTDVAAIDGDGDFLTTGDNTDALQEGSSNLYYTNARSRAAISATSPVSYDSSTGVISLDATSVDGEVDTLTLTTLNFGSTPDASVAWDSVNGTLSVDYGTFSLNVGQQDLYYAKASAAIAKGDVVMFAGVQGDHVLIAKADMSATGFMPEWVMGVAAQAFATNAFGYVVAFGKLTGYSTSTLTAGDLLYLSASTPGALTTTEPAYPNHSILMAAALNSTNNGTILIRPTHKSDLDELHNVVITSAASGDVLSWSGTNWVNTDLDTDGVDEGSTNLYYTDTRVGNYLSTNGFDTASNIIATIVDSAPTTLDTLNELAAALGDDPNYASTVTTALGTKLNTADFTSTANTWIGTKDTDDLTEGSTNLYYTDGRVQAVVTQTYINNLNVDADTVDGKHYDDIISEATALSIALG